MHLSEIREMQRPETRSEGPWPCIGPAQRYFTVQHEETKLEKWYKQNKNKQRQQKAEVWPDEPNWSWHFNVRERTANLKVQEHAAKQQSEVDSKTQVRKPSVREIGKEKRKRNAAEREVGLAEKQLEKAKTAVGDTKTLTVVSSSACNVRNAYWTDKW